MITSESENARKHFADSGLAYSDITEGDICVLVMLLNRRLKCKKYIGSISTLRMSQKIKAKYTTAGRLKKCFLYINSHYFTQREAISFNESGFINFCGWADEKNTAPVVDAFMEWVNYLKKGDESCAI
jgi:hypothetical protein